jgi:hypothetical protein
MRDIGEPATSSQINRARDVVTDLSATPPDIAALEPGFATGGRRSQ